MPTLSISAALLVLGKTEALPWSSPTWQDLTNSVGVPWETLPDATPDAPAPNVPSWSTHVAQSVKAYAQNLWARSDTMDQIRYSARATSDNDSTGRSAWNSWVDDHWNKSWNLGRRVNEVFEECKCTQYDALSRAKTQHLPTLDDAQVPGRVTIPLAHALFGDSAYDEGDAGFLKIEVKNFIDVLMVITWHRYRQAVKGEITRLQKRQDALDVDWLAITQEGMKPTIKMIKLYLTRLERVLKILLRYKDSKSIAAVQAKRKTLEAMLAVAQNDDTMKDDIDKLPKVLRDALQKLASAEDVQQLELLLKVALETLDSDDAGPPVQLPEGPSLDFPWQEGTEDLAKVSEDDLWANLGLKESKRLPFFQEFTDPDGAIEPWSDEGEKWLASDSNPREPLRPRWHQLVGIYRMLERAFESQPVLLMDGVGIGKTFQVIGFVACLAFFHRYFEKNNKFPGAFASKKWQGQEDNIPNLPVVITCPVNLHNQWSREIERFLKRGTFDLFPYTGKLGSRRQWWTDIFPKSQHILLHRIVLVTESALQDDASVVFMDVLRDVTSTLRNAPSRATRGEITLYGSKYLALIVDEAHQARKFNKIHTAIYALRAESAAMVAMTATPVMTKLHDLWIMGHVMGIPAFANKDKFDEMKKELNRAQARDRKAERASDDAADRLRGLLKGLEEHNTIANSELYPKIQEWMPRIRDAFAKHVIRRTLDSVDNLGEKIFGMQPYREHIMLVELREWETQALSALTSEIADDSALPTIAGAGKVSPSSLLWKRASRTPPPRMAGHTPHSSLTIVVRHAGVTEARHQLSITFLSACAEIQLCCTQRASWTPVF
ncbi:hypothetical protein JVU11DRAFT_12148 [Chiua virens]|nr:hypothetical protein JVU11DRAFT_12148 [Chiua virens]